MININIIIIFPLFCLCKWHCADASSMTHGMCRMYTDTFSIPSMSIGPLVYAIFGTPLPALCTSCRA